MDRFLSLAACTILFAQLTAAQSATVSPVAQAASASPISRALNPSYAGFGIEPSNLFSFTGGSGGANALSVNLLQNLAGYSGAPAHLRIGGNTADNFIYDASYTSYGLRTNANPTGQGNVPCDKWSIGPNYFAAIDRFPTGTPVTFGLNLPYEASDYISVISTMAQAAIDNLKNVQLYSFEIGNEPDLYLQNAFRSGTWDGSTYTSQWLARAAGIYTNVLKPAGLPANFFEGPTTASTIGNTFEIPQLYNDGIMGGSNGASTYLAGWNQHDYFYFVDVSGFPLTLDYLSQLSNTESQFAYWAKQVGIALDEGIPYYLREMASAGPTGLQGISNTFAGSLWTLNFFCYAATVGVMSVQMHMTDNSWAAAWQPIQMHGDAPNVRPSYYAHAAMAQLIGSGNGTTQISPLSMANVPSGYPDYVRAYSVYTQGSLSAVVIVNAKTSNASVTSKPSLSITLTLPSAKGQILYISTLTAAGSDSTAGTTWNGLSFESNSDGTSSVSDSRVQTAQVGSDGTVTLTVRDASAIIANIGFQLGTRAVTVNGTTGATGTAASGPRKTSSADSSSTGASTAAVIAAATAATTLVTSVGAAGSSTTTHSDASAGLARPFFGPHTARSIFVISIALSVGVAALASRW